MAPRVALLLIAITLGLGCRLSDDTWDFPTAAFARVRGVVRQADGAPVAGAFVDLACGGEALVPSTPGRREPAWMGRLSSTPARHKASLLHQAAVRHSSVAA